jgi:light-regulated signal transduction histidine kinase (bacteriophytochrome)
VANRELEAFSYSVAHDLRAPLRSIDGFASILQEDYGEALGEEGRRLLGIIRSSGQAMDILTQDLLELTKAGKTDPVKIPVDMGALATETFGLCADPSVLAGFDFTVRELPAAMADRSMMRQVWLNLLSNAVKYSVPGKVHRIEVDGLVKDGMNVYSVRDHGAGFDQRYVGKLFGLFQRLHGSEEFQGTGIGLSIVKMIIERHGGKVWAEGSVGKGATFSFAIPTGEA